MNDVMERVIQLETMFKAIRSVTKHMPDDKEKEMILGFEKLSHEMLDTIKRLHTENERYERHLRGIENTPDNMGNHMRARDALNGLSK